VEAGAVVEVVGVGVGVKGIGGRRDIPDHH